MGCHTWFYKKMEKQPTLQECKDMLISQYNEEIQECHDYMKGKIDDEDLLKIWRQYDPQEIINEYYNYLDRVNSNDEEFIYHEAAHTIFIKNINGGVIKYYKNNFYISSDDLPHDVFRVWGYPETILKSYDDFEKFIASHEYKCDDLAEAKKQMKTFWNDYPDGIVDFG